LGGTVPQYTFEVERAEGVALTSVIYPIEDIESAEGSGAEVASSGYYLNDSAESTGLSLLSGDLRAALKIYSGWPEESLESTGFELISGDLRPGLFIYSEWPEESLESTGFDLMSGEMEASRIGYENWPHESAESTGFELIGGNIE
jgi:hypothetical protein